MVSKSKKRENEARRSRFLAALGVSVFAALYLFVFVGGMMSGADGYQNEGTSPSAETAAGITPFVYVGLLVYIVVMVVLLAKGMQNRKIIFPLMIVVLFLFCAVWMVAASGQTAIWIIALGLPIPTLIAIGIAFGIGYGVDGEEKRGELK